MDPERPVLALLDGLVAHAPTATCFQNSDLKKKNWFQVHAFYAVCTTNCFSLNLKKKTASLFLYKKTLLLSFFIKKCFSFYECWESFREK